MLDKKPKSVVWKFDIPDSCEFIINMPKGAEIMSLQVQRGVPRIWALVNPQNLVEHRTFVLIYTGSDAGYPQERLRPIGTIQRGGLVYHLLEIV